MFATLRVTAFNSVMLRVTLFVMLSVARSFQIVERSFVNATPKRMCHDDETFDSNKLVRFRFSLRSKILHEKKLLLADFMSIVSIKTRGQCYKTFLSAIYGLSL